MSNFAISLYGAEGQIHSFEVSTSILVKVYQTLMESNEAKVIESLDLDLDFDKSMPESTKPKPVFLQPVITRGTKPGYCQLSFSSKPSEEQLNELKASGFRWARVNQVWYGVCSDLPLRYEIPDMVSAPVEADPEPQKPEPIHTPRVEDKTPHKLSDAALPRDDKAFAESLAGLLANI